MDDLMWNRGPIGGPFALTDHRGKLRYDSEFRGKLLVIYFGYTYCPDICPTDLMAISQAIVALGTAGDMVQPLFITIDPERDTKARLAEYVPVFHRRLIGLTVASGGNPPGRPIIQGLLRQESELAEVTITPSTTRG